MNEVMKAIRARRSTRAFTDEQLTRAEMDTLLEAAVWAPSGMGKQLWHFVGIRNAERNLELARAVAEADHRGPEYNFYGAPASIIVCYKADEMHAYLDGSAAIENILLAATSLGLGSCWINQLRNVCYELPVRKLLTAYGVPEDYMVIGSVALGHIAKETPAKARREGTVTVIE